MAGKRRTPSKRRDASASALTSPLFRSRIKPSAKKYNRKKLKEADHGSTSRT